jgi:hypothetical protein
MMTALAMLLPRHTESALSYVEVVFPFLISLNISGGSASVPFSDGIVRVVTHQRLISWVIDH